MQIFIRDCSPLLAFKKCLVIDQPFHLAFIGGTCTDNYGNEVANGCFEFESNVGIGNYVDLFETSLGVTLSSALKSDYFGLGYTNSPPLSITDPEFALTITEGYIFNIIRPTTQIFESPVKLYLNIFEEPPPSPPPPFPPPPPGAPPIPLPPPTPALPPPPPLGCTLDFIRADPSDVNDVLYESDGYLVTEFTYMQQMQREIQMSADPSNGLTANIKDFTCLVAEIPKAECLDIASIGTLGQLTVEDYYWSATYHNVTTLFGQECNGKIVGDGTINAHDFAALMWYQFRQAPYDTLPTNPANVLTTQGRENTAQRCFVNETRTDWLLSLGEDFCSAGLDIDSRTAVIEPEKLDDLMVYPWAMSENEGGWVKIHLPDIPLATELIIQGIDHDAVGVLSNEIPPDLGCLDCKPMFDADKVVVTFQRQMDKLAPRSVRSCAHVISAGPDVVLGSVISLRQAPPSLACPLDVFVWIPVTMSAARKLSNTTVSNVTHGRSLQLNRCEGDFVLMEGSNMMNGEEGLVFRDRYCVDIDKESILEIARTLSPPPPFTPPLPPPPTPPPPLPTSPPPSPTSPPPVPSSPSPSLPTTYTFASYAVNPFAVGIDSSMTVNDLSNSILSGMNVSSGTQITLLQYFGVVTSLVNDEMTSGLTAVLCPDETCSIEAAARRRLNALTDLLSASNASYIGNRALTPSDTLVAPSLDVSALDDYISSDYTVESPVLVALVLEFRTYDSEVSIYSGSLIQTAIAESLGIAISEVGVVQRADVLSTDSDTGPRNPELGWIVSLVVILIGVCMLVGSFVLYEKK